MSDGFHPGAGNTRLHVGIIPDGGRRWARIHGCPLVESYLRSRTLLLDLTGVLFNKGVSEISIYLASIQNFKREPAELEPILRIVESSLHNEILSLAKLHELKLVFAGNREIIPLTLCNEIRSVEEQTSDHKGGRLNFLFAYDSGEEIIEAYKKSTDQDIFLNHLWITSPVDLIIRSGGAKLLSNFLPLQSAWARLYFTPKLFNDLTLDDILGFLRDFEQIERKYGN